MSKVVCVVETYITEDQLNEFIDAINDMWVGRFGGEDLLTMEEVLGNEELLHYICNQAVEDGRAMYDPDEFINGDGWCDVADYR